jgi:phosphate transport system ATP-binding protein
MSNGAPEESMSPETLEAAPPAAPRMRVPAAAAPAGGPSESKLKVKGLDAWYGDKQALFGIDLAVPAREVTAMIGPSGCGKSTLIRCLNRMHETVPGAHLEGSITYEGHEILGPLVDPVAVRRRIGMVFQKPTPFPTLSIFDNVAAGLRLHGERNAKKIAQVVEQSLRKAALWEEVKDVLNKPGGSLSGGQQQRLCIARGLAIETDVLLLDEPCSALDPISTAKIEELLFELKNSYTIVIVTHNMQQAARVSQKTLFMLAGKLIEFGETNQMFTAPHNKLTEDYITGRFG